ncbi:MAG TPA: IS1595 family transposase [Candidatus Aquilonibacter sp.]|nr:IS1595 family transposase [Candidatus Aquilonibacter sp.]
MKETKTKYTVKEFNAQFPDDAACLQFIFEARWPDGGKCKCGKADCFYPVKGRRSYACSWCGYQISPTAGTIFHKSETSLKSWFFAMFLMASSKNGVAAKELERQLGVTYKTAHRMGHKIRQLMQGGGGMLNGICEADETYIGGIRRGGKRGRGSENKTPVIGVLERGGNVIAKVAADVKTQTVLPNILANVEKGATVCTDELWSYNPLRKSGFKHHRVAHGAREYVRGNIHTNSIEGFWSQLKRSINGTFHHVSPQHLQKYVNEFVYRYNLRGSEQPIFSDLSARVVEQHG